MVAEPGSSRQLFKALHLEDFKQSSCTALPPQQETNLDPMLHHR